MRCASNIEGFSEHRKASRIAALRTVLEGLRPNSAASANAVACLGPGLPGPALACGVLHEIIAGHADRAAAFGFLFALTAAALKARDCDLAERLVREHLASALPIPTNGKSK